jgi:hypothetical protein
MRKQGRTARRPAGPCSHMGSKVSPLPSLCNGQRRQAKLRNKPPTDELEPARRATRLKTKYRAGTAGAISSTASNGAESDERGSGVRRGGRPVGREGLPDAGRRGPARRGARGVGARGRRAGLGYRLRAGAAGPGHGRGGGRGGTRARRRSQHRHAGPFAGALRRPALGRIRDRRRCRPALPGRRLRRGGLDPGLRVRARYTGGARRAAPGAVPRRPDADPRHRLRLLRHEHREPGTP